jgi:hypothetical protein
MNNFLNESLKASMPQPGSNRMPLSYAHKKERDTFYEISASDLPPIVQHNLHPRHKPKIRVTTNQQTGEVIAKIVKCRIADLDVYSPRTSLDWRISVNLEMNYDGDVRNLLVSDGGGRGRTGGERIKDRMSYRHLAYQIDLTQVAIAEVCNRLPSLPSPAASRSFPLMTALMIAFSIKQSPALNMSLKSKFLQLKYGVRGNLHWLETLKTNTSY